MSLLAGHSVNLFSLFFAGHIFLSIAFDNHCLLDIFEESRHQEGRRPVRDVGDGGRGALWVEFTIGHQAHVLPSLTT